MQELPAWKRVVAEKYAESVSIFQYSAKEKKIWIL